MSKTKEIKNGQRKNSIQIKHSLLVSKALDRDADDGTKSDEAFQESVSKLQREFLARF